MTPQHVRGGFRIFEVGGGGEAAESIGHVPEMLQFENWNLTLEILTMLQIKMSREFAFIFALYLNLCVAYSP